MICQLLVCEICETIFHIYECVFGPLISFRIFAYKTNIGGECLFQDLECSMLCLYAKILNFAYFRINQVK